MRKGRGHYHLKNCPGEDEYGEKKYCLGVKHCLPDEHYYPFPDKDYDKYLC